MKKLFRIFPLALTITLLLAWPSRPQSAGTFYYVVTATDVNGLESIYSTQASATISTAKSKVLLTWTLSVSPNIATQSVYRATVSGGPYTKIASVSASAVTYTDPFSPPAEQTGLAAVPSP